MKISFFLPSLFLILISSFPTNTLMAENDKKNIFPKQTSREYFINGLKQWEMHDNDKEAIKNYKKALDLDPNNIYALLFRAESYWRQKNYDDALNDLNTVLRIDPQNKYAIYDRAKVHADAGRYLIAIKHFSESIEKGIELENAYANRGMLHSLTGNASDACSDWRKSISSGNDIGSEYAAEQFKSKCEKDVFEQFQKNVKVNSLIRSGRNKFDLGDRRGACEDYFEAKKYGYKSKKASLFDKLFVNSYCFFVTRQ